jgi:hypothetical protein
MDRRLEPARLADRIGAGAAGQVVERLQAGAGAQPLPDRLMTVDRDVVALRQPLRAARVVRERDEDRRRGERVEPLEHLAVVVGEQRVYEQHGVAGVHGERGDLGAPFAGMPLRVPRRPAPEPGSQLLH